MLLFVLGDGVWRLWPTSASATMVVHRSIKHRKEYARSLHSTTTGRREFGTLRCPTNLPALSHPSLCHCHKQPSQRQAFPIDRVLPYRSTCFSRPSSTSRRGARPNVSAPPPSPNSPLTFGYQKDHLCSPARLHAGPRSFCLENLSHPTPRSMTLP